MNYLVLLYDDEGRGPQPGTPEWDADMAGFEAFGELAGEAIVGGEALEPAATAFSIRHDGDDLTVTAGPFAETTEVLGGFFVLDAPSLDDAMELAREIPTAATGAIEIRPMVQWFDSTRRPDGPGTARHLVTIHGPETDADRPGTDAWDEGASAHGRFAEAAGEVVIAGGAVEPADTATTIRIRDGELLVTDGPFAEATEVVGGLYVLGGDVDAVRDVARRVPVGPGGGVEVRPVMDLEG